MTHAPSRQPSWIPNTNVFISASGQLIVQVELGGIHSDDLQLTKNGRELRIAGQRRNSEFATAKTILVHEINTGPFESVLELPPGFDLARSSSAFLNGVLRVIVPKKDSSQPPQLPLNN